MFIHRYQNDDDTEDGSTSGSVVIIPQKERKQRKTWSTCAFCKLKHGPLGKKAAKCRQNQSDGMGGDEADDAESISNEASESLGYYTDIELVVDSKGESVQWY